MKFCTTHGQQGGLDRFCPKCGEKLQTKDINPCRRCGAETFGEPFCWNCGECVDRRGDIYLYRQSMYPPPLPTEKRFWRRVADRFGFIFGVIGAFLFVVFVYFFFHIIGL